VRSGRKTASCGWSKTSGTCRLAAQRLTAAGSTWPGLMAQLQAASIGQGDTASAGASEEVEERHG
jgi:hypothetical protein